MDSNNLQDNTAPNGDDKQKNKKSNNPLGDTASSACCKDDQTLVDRRQKRINIIAIAAVGLIAVLVGIVLPLAGAKQINYTQYNESLPSVVAVGKISCPACSDQKHVFGQLAESLNGKVNIIYYDKGSEFAKQLVNERDVAITLFPTLLFIDSSDNIVMTVSGSLTESGLLTRLSALGWVG